MTNTLVRSVRVTRFDGMGIGRLGSVTLECTDPQRLASFWAHLLGGEVLGSDQVAAVRAGDIRITAVRVAEHRPSSWPDEPAGRHLDVSVDDLESLSWSVV